MNYPDRSKDPNSKTWVIADTHFGHTNVIKYSNRPYSNAEEMNTDLINKWNSVVRKNDLVYFLGDFAFKMDKQMISDIVKKLNGRIFMICGNHDTRTLKFYLECGFVQAIKHPILIHHNIILKHTPPVKDEIINGMNYVFGHIHNNPNPDTDNLKNCKCVSCELTDYKPVDLDEIINEFNKNNKE